MQSFPNPGLNPYIPIIISVVAHGAIGAGLALLPASGGQKIGKTTRIVRLLPSSTPTQPLAIDPNAPPPIPGVAGLPPNLTAFNNIPDLNNNSGTSPNDSSSTAVTSLNPNSVNRFGQDQSRGFSFPGTPVPGNTSNQHPTSTGTRPSQPAQNQVPPGWKPEAGKSPELEPGKAGPLPPPNENVPNGPVASNSTNPPSPNPPSSLVAVGTIVTRSCRSVVIIICCTTITKIIRTTLYIHRIDES
ncbi:MAG: hypothetical protein HC934_11455 [Acaryochloridaceae cyanobacterium SU_2_1]|nr:hypothetical protein [Acaryochloridaceae cyanobacterium SU_2_1]